MRSDSRQPCPGSSSRTPAVPDQASEDPRAPIVLEVDGQRILLDPTSLREVALDPEGLGRWCEEHPEDPHLVAHLRILGRLDEAAEAGLRFLQDASTDPLTRAVRRARHAHVLQFQGRFEAAEEQFDLAAEETGLGDPTSRSGLLVLASVFQHRAKARWEHALAVQASSPVRAGELLDAALGDARLALTMRERLEAGPSELASTRQTLARIGGTELPPRS